MVSIGFYDLCPSPRVAKGRRQKEINPFVYETTVSACIIIIIIIIIIIAIQYCKLSMLMFWSLIFG